MGNLLEWYKFLLGIYTLICPPSYEELLLSRGRRGCVDIKDKQYQQIVLFIKKMLVAHKNKTGLPCGKLASATVLYSRVSGSTPGGSSSFWDHFYLSKAFIATQGLSSLF